MTPEQIESIEGKLDAILSDARDTNGRVRFLESNASLMNESLVGLSKRVAELEAARVYVPPPQRPPSPSFTNEVSERVAENVGNSMMPAARALRSSAFVQAGFGCVIALALLAFLIFGHH